MRSDLTARLSDKQHGAFSPHSDFQNPFLQDNAGDQALHQLVNNRADSVTQSCGQVTPPKEDSATGQAARSKQVQEHDAMERKERARNAANKRHIKSKKARTGSGIAGGDNDTGGERGERQAHYREKNKLAAAKCRAKKKDRNDLLEEMHRNEASKNKTLRADLMGLRNMLAQLRGLTLEHGPNNCQCYGIHEYSMRQARLIARAIAPQYNPSPSQEGASSIDSPPLGLLGISSPVMNR